MTVNMKTNDNGAFALAEYSALREEILKRIEFQNNIINSDPRHRGFSGQHYRSTIKQCDDPLHCIPL